MNPGDGAVGPVARGSWIGEDAGKLAPRLRQTLEARGFQVGAMEPITPSLEDVFVSLIEARDRADGAQQEFKA